MPRTHRQHWTSEDRQARRYRYVSFDVPPGAAGVAVHLDYDASLAVVDLGVLDPEGFRGYSGGARDRFAITGVAATPGYLPGPLPAGEWRVLLGLHRVPPEGVDTLVTVEVGDVRPEPPPSPPRPSAKPARRELPAAPGRRWLAGDLHAHTLHSDGVLTIDELADLARGRGLDFLAVTDHNTISHHRHLDAAGRRAEVLLLPGQEVTTAEGHANCIGDAPWVDFREPADRWVDHAQAAGALLSVNHPLAGDCRWRKPLSRRPPLAEVWHSTWDRRVDDPLSWWARWGGVGVGGSDLHDPARDTLGAPTTWVEVAGGGEPDGAAVLSGLAAGRVALSCDPRGPVLVRRDDALVAVDADGATLIAPDGRRVRVRGPAQTLPGGDGPFRLVGDHGTVLALTA
ncbi:MAG: CehA/McbA family metallohydrolase [Egibacteraceae bacterium]